MKEVAQLSVQEGEPRTAVLSRSLANLVGFVIKSVSCERRQDYEARFLVEMGKPFNFDDLGDVSNINFLDNPEYLAKHVKASIYLPRNSLLSVVAMDVFMEYFKKQNSGQ